MFDFISYIKVVFLFLALSISGVIILRRFIDNNHPQLVIPTGVIFGIGIFIFQINLFSHIIKGLPVFLLALILQLSIAALIHFKFRILKMDYPRGKFLFFWIISLVFWTVFLYQITAHSIIDGADSTIYYSLAARFGRGDYPMHVPWQPDYIAYNHIGGPQFLGAVRSIINVPYYFLHASLALISLLTISQILTWLLERKINNVYRLLIASLPAITAIISLGSFMVAIPININLPEFDKGFLEWLKQMPTLVQAFESYGSPSNLDALILFLHRFLAISLFIASLTPLLYPKGKSTLFVLIILISSIALVDETIFLATFLPMLIIIFFTIFKKNFVSFVIFSLLIATLVLIQGGILTEAVLNRYNEKPSVLFFPEDGERSSEHYRTYRLHQQGSYLFRDQKYLPFNWFHPSIHQQIFLLILLLEIYYLFFRQKDSKLIFLLWMMFFSALITLILYNGLVPKGYAHTNGNRFLTLSFYLSGIGIAIFTSNWFMQNYSSKNLIYLLTKGLIVWILIGSIVPPFVSIFPRKRDNFFKIYRSTPNPTLEWIKDNIDKDKRIIALVDINPIPASNLDLVKEAGALTPIWAPNIRVHDSFDMSPTYADLYYSLNPEIIKILKVDYIMTNKRYTSKLPKQRQEDLENIHFFQSIFSPAGNDIVIRRIQEKFLNEGVNLDGTFTQMGSIAPMDGNYFIDYPPNITENIFRALRLLLHNRKIYYNPRGAFYNARIDVEVNFYGENAKRYDYLVLGEKVDPKTICNCDALLFWTGLGNGVKLWKTQN